MIYDPAETQLMKLAKERGAEVIPGIEMFVHQAARQFEIWTGKPAPWDDMMRVVTLALQERAWGASERGKKIMRPESSDSGVSLHAYRAVIWSRISNGLTSGLLLPDNAAARTRRKPFSISRPLRKSSSTTKPKPGNFRAQ